MTQDFTDQSYQSRFVYRIAPRPAFTLDSLTFERLGHMNETLTDLLFLNQLLETSPHAESAAQSALLMGDIAEIKPAALPPSYMTRIFGDVRATDSYFRRDRSHDWQGVYPSAPRKGPVADAAEQAHFEHRILRRIGSVLGDTLDVGKLPDTVKGQAKKYIGLIDHYGTLIKKCGGRHDAIPADVLNAYNAELTEAMQELKAACAQTPSFSVTLKGHRIEVPNTAPINYHLSESYPLLVMLMLTSAGRKAIDKDRYPLAGFKFETEIIGVASLISETMKCLLSHIERATGETLLKEPGFDKKAYLQHLKKHSRDLKLLYQFHKTAGRAYPAAYKDIEDRLALVHETPELETLRNSDEIAAMLYATAKKLEPECRAAEVQEMRAARIAPDPRTPSQIAAQLLQLADGISHAETLEHAGSLIASRKKILAKACEFIDSSASDMQSSGRAGLDLIARTLPHMGLFRNDRQQAI